MYKEWRKSKNVLYMFPFSAERHIISAMCPFKLCYLRSRQFPKIAFGMFPSTFGTICMHFYDILCRGIHIGLLEGILVKNRKVLVTRFIQLALCWPSVAAYRSTLLYMMFNDRKQCFFRTCTIRNLIYKHLNN